MPKTRYENSIWLSMLPFMIYPKFLYKYTVKLRAKSEEVNLLLCIIGLYIWALKGVGVKMNGKVYQNNVTKIRVCSGSKRS